MNHADYLLHASNLLLLASYSVRDVLWLRWFAVAAALIALPYYFTQDKPLVAAAFWAIVFAGINLYQIARIYLERRPVVMSADERKLYDLGFRALHPREFVALVLIGEWRDARAGDQVITQGEPVSCICVAIDGSLLIRTHERTIVQLGPGKLIGAAFALTGDVSSVSAVFTEAGRYISWPLAQLREFADRRPALRSILQRLVSRDLSQKLEQVLMRRSREAAGEPQSTATVSGSGP